MNGFRLSFLLFLLSGCTQRYLKTQEGDSVFFVYKAKPRYQLYDTTIWSSPEKYLLQEKNISEDSYNLINILDSDFIVIRVGNFRNNAEFFVDRVNFKSGGALLSVYLKKVETKRTSDLGYLIFVKQKYVKQIHILTNKNFFYMTNI